MSSSRSWGGVAALVAVGVASSSTGCASVLGLDEFGAGSGEGGSGAASPSTSTGDATTSTDASTGGGPGGGGDGGAGDGGAGGGGAGATSTGTAGGGGAGGGEPPLSCVADAPFDVFSSLDLGGARPDDERLALATAPGSNRVHVAVVTHEGDNVSRVVARTMRVGAVPELQQIVSFPAAADQMHRRVVGGYTTPGRVHFWGTQGATAGEFVASADEDIAGQLAFVAYPRPQACFDTRDVHVHQDASGVARFAATCVSQLDAYLYGGTTTELEFVVGPVPMDQFQPPDDMAVRGYAHVGGEHVIFTGRDGLEVDGTFIRSGSTAEELGTVRPVSAPPDHGVIFVPGPEVEGQLFLAALHANPGLVNEGTIAGSRYRTGAVTAADVPALSEDVTSVLDEALEFTSLADVAPFFTLKRSGSLVLSAARTMVQSGNDVALGGWRLDGRVAVDRFRVYEAPQSNAVLAADVAPAGFGTQAVAWTERVGADTFRVRASGVQCLAEE